MPSSHTGSRNASRRSKNHACSRSLSSAFIPVKVPLNNGLRPNSPATSAAAAVGGLSGCARSDSANKSVLPSRPEAVWRASLIVGSSSSRGSSSSMSVLTRRVAFCTPNSTANPTPSSTTSASVARHGATGWGMGTWSDDMEAKKTRLAAATAYHLNQDCSLLPSAF